MATRLKHFTRRVRKVKGAAARPPLPGYRLLPRSGAALYKPQDEPPSEKELKAVLAALAGAME